MSKSDSVLRQVGYELAEEIRDGKWQTFTPSKAGVISNQELLREFRLRCTGHTDAEYQKALAKGLHDSR